MSAVDIKMETEWDILPCFQDDMFNDAPGISFQPNQVTCEAGWDTVLQTYFPDQAPSVLKASNCGVEQAVARANHERKELEVRLAQYAAKTKLLEDIVMQSRDNNHNDDGHLNAVDPDLETPNPPSGHTSMKEACSLPGVYVPQQQKIYVKVSPFWLGQNLELDEQWCLWWEMC
ncbi:hypothetical protein MMC26_004785 [Xylographa opegraphella]|nr:hypothetical protein [Xylographa opegraphella]